MGIAPKALADRPRILEHDRYYLDIYYDLGASRRYNQAGVQPIPVADIAAYLDIICVEQPADRYRVFKMIRRLDGAYLKHVMKPDNQSKEKA